MNDSETNRFGTVAGRGVRYWYVVYCTLGLTPVTGLVTVELMLNYARQ